MYASVLAARDRRVAGLVAMTPDATWENWFLKYWLGFTGAAAGAYAALFDGIEPAVAVGTVAARRPVLLQFAETDIFIDAATRARFAAAAPSAVLTTYTGVGHELGVGALADRTPWLDDLLRLA
jgi:hypothetical protein